MYAFWVGEAKYKFQSDTLSSQKFQRGEEKNGPNFVWSQREGFERLPYP